MKLSIFDLMNPVCYSAGLVLMEHARKRVQNDTSLAPSVVHQLRLLDNCNLLKTHVDDAVDIEEILTQICDNKSKKKARKSQNHLTLILQVSPNFLFSIH